MKANLNPRLIIALDFEDVHTAYQLVDQLTPERCRLKVGKEMFTRCGPTFVERLVKKGFDVFLDLKFHDIPSTVAKASRAAADLGVWMFNVHALGGPAMLEAAREALVGWMGRRPLLVAVTLLTSMTAEDLPQIGLTGTLEENVLRLTQSAKNASLDGVVCSSLEAELIRSHMGSDFYLVTPGIRLEHSTVDDQRRINTPLAALQAGADFLVVGRAITLAQNPMHVISSIEKEIEQFVVI